MPERYSELHNFPRAIKVFREEQARNKEEMFALDILVITINDKAGESNVAMQNIKIDAMSRMSFLSTRQIILSRIIDLLTKAIEEI